MAKPIKPKWLPSDALASELGWVVKNKKSGKVEVLISNRGLLAQLETFDIDMESIDEVESSPEVVESESLGTFEPLESVSPVVVDPTPAVEVVVAEAEKISKPADKQKRKYTKKVK